MQITQILQAAGSAQADDLRHLLCHFDQHTVLLHVHLQRAKRAGNDQLFSLAVRNGDNDNCE